MVKPIPNFPDYYVTDSGIIISSKPNNQHSKSSGTPLVLKARTDGKGYLSVGLSKGGKQFPRKVHRLVMETFIGECPNGMEVCHNDGNILNNNLNNLRYDTHKNNMRDRTIQKRGYIPLGELNGQAKFNKFQIRIIRKFCSMDGMGAQKYIARLFNVHRSTIGNIVNNNTWTSR
jgi:hypothetical protein